MGYYVDLKSIGIDKYKKVLETSELIPSWKILLDGIDKNFHSIMKHNIENLDDLLNTLKSKNLIKEFSEATGVQEEYLKILKRVIKGYKQKPNKIKEFSCISDEVGASLEKIGVKNTYELYEMILTQERRKVLSEKTGINKEEVLKLAKLTDLSRIRWVNHTFAYVLLTAGYDTVEKVVKSDYKELYKVVKQLNEERKIYKAHIGEGDMKMVIESAQMLDIEVEY
jgi:hypothetical protein